MKRNSRKRAHRLPATYNPDALVPAPFFQGWEPEGQRRKASCRDSRRKTTKSMKTMQKGENNNLAISQAELHDLETAREAARKADTLRKDLVVRLSNGASVQPGPLRAEIVVAEVKMFSFASLVEVVGTDAAEALRAKIRPTKQTRLLIKKVYSRESSK